MWGVGVWGVCGVCVWGVCGVGCVECVVWSVWVWSVGVCGVGVHKSDDSFMGSRSKQASFG